MRAVGRCCWSSSATMAEDDDEDRHAILEGLEAISEEGELETISWEELMKHNTEDDLWCAPIDARIALFPAAPALTTNRAGSRSTTSCTT